MFQGVSVQTYGFPVVQKGCAQALIKVDRRSIPVEYLPAQVKAILFSRHRRHAGQQRLANSLSPVLAANIKVLKKESRTPLKAGVVVEEQRIAGRFAVPFRHQHVESGRFTEPIAQQPSFVDGGGKTLEGGKLMDERIQRGHVAGQGRAN